MKTQKLRVLTLGLAVACAVFGTGHTGSEAPADVPVFTAPPEAQPRISDSLDTESIAVAEAGDEAQGAAPSVTSTNTGTNAIKVVQEPVLPEKVSPALQEIVKLVQAGISEAVILSYITNSTNVFNVTSDEIVYLNDLGISSEVMTAIIQRDNTAEARDHKQVAQAAKPLPPGASLSAPATNIYKQGQSTVQVYPDSQTSLPPAYEETEPATAYAPPAEEQQPVTVNHFYTSLSPYGSWVEVPEYGLCWRPTVAVVDPYWAPYRNNGRWLYTDYGWYWYSDYSWGWAPFHYGRWCSYPGYGWVWSPGTRWGPAWVTWRYSSSHCGWAPLPPHCDYVDGFGLYYRRGAVSVSFGFGLSSDCYTFIPINRFCDRRPGLHYVSIQDNKTFYQESVVINNYASGRNNAVINRGIGVERIARANRGEVPRAEVRVASLSNGKTTHTRVERIETTGGRNAVVVAPQLAPSARQGQVARPNQNRGKTGIVSDTSPNGAKPHAVGSFTPIPNSARNAAPAQSRSTASNPNRNLAPNAAPTPNRNATTDRALPTPPANRPLANDNRVVVAGGPQQASPAPAAQGRPNARNNGNKGESPVFGSRLVSGNQQRNTPAAQARPDANTGANQTRPHANVELRRSHSQPQSHGNVIHGVNPGVRQNQPAASVNRPVQRMEVVRSGGDGGSHRQTVTHAPAPRASHVPSYHAAPRASAPSHHASPRHSGPSYHASPPQSSHRAHSPAASAPSVQRSAPAHHGGGGGGGGNRGGGGGGGRGNRDR